MHNAHLHPNQNIFDVADATNINALIIPCGPDFANEAIATAIRERYTDFDKNFAEVISGDLTPGFTYAVPVERGIVFLMVVKEDSKYSASVPLIQKAFMKLVFLAPKHSVREFVIPAFDGQVTKLLNFIILPYTASLLACSHFVFHIADANDSYKYVIFDWDMLAWSLNGATLKWLSDDDKFFTVALIMMLWNGNRVSKSSVLKLYLKCKESMGMFSDITVEQTDYGQYFKEFPKKWFLLINNGIIAVSKGGFSTGPCANFYVSSMMDITAPKYESLMTLTRFMEKNLPKHQRKWSGENRDTSASSAKSLFG